MTWVNQTRSKRLLAVHGWSATLLGLLLYVVLLTGSIAVFALEIGQWSAGGVRSNAPLNQPLDDKIRSLANTVDDRFLDEVSVFSNSGGALIVLFHTHETNAVGDIADIGVRFTLDPRSMSIVARHEGFLADLTADEEGALDDFLTELHINLHAPEPWGLYATGILGFAMLVAVISGIILHKHLLKDLFVSPRFSSLLLNRRDRHVLAGSWGLPFGFVLAFTGTFFSFGASIGLPLVAIAAFDGDQVKMIETVIGHSSPVNEVPAPTANIDQLLATSTQAAGTSPTSFTVSHWGRADASVIVAHAADAKALYGAAYLLDGVTGELLGVQPTLGKVESAGSSLFSLMRPLHFGTFGGMLSKVVWFSLGVAMCYVTVSGLNLWTLRRFNEPGWAWMNRAIIATVYGLPLAMATCALAFFIALPAQSASDWTPAGFLVGAILAMLAAVFIKDVNFLRKIIGRGLVAVVISLPLVRMFFGGAAWAELLAARQIVVFGFDLVLLCAAAVLALRMRRPVPLEVQEPSVKKNVALDR